MVFAGAVPNVFARSLDNLRAAGQITCGVANEAAGFSVQNDDGRWVGFDADLCRAIGVAVFNDANAVRFRPLNMASRYRSLRQGEIDVLLGDGTWTLSRDSDLGIRFVAATFFDGQSFLVPRSQGILSSLELSGATVCVLSGTRARGGVERYFTERRMRFVLKTFAHWDEAVAAYRERRCTVLTGDMSELVEVRAQWPERAEHIILPEILEKEPRGPAVRAENEALFAIVRWVLNAMVLAEEYGVSQSGLTESRRSRDVRVRGLLGLDGNVGAGLGLDPQFVDRIIGAVGNYGDVFRRHLGRDSKLGMDRRLNRLWTEGGLMYGLPMR